jgi:hypothetical protein
VWNSAKKWSDGMGGGISHGVVRQNMEKFPAMAMKVAHVSL